MIRPFWRPWQVHASLARYTLVVYVVSVLIPCFLSTALAYRWLRNGMEEDAQARLRQDAREYGLAVYSRLLEADHVLARRASALVLTGDNLPSDPEPDSPFVSVRFIRADMDADGDQAGDPSGGWELAAAADEALRSSAQNESTILFTEGGSKPVPVLVRTVPGDGRLFAVGWLRPDYLLGGSERLPGAARLCIGARQGRIRFCRPEEDPIAASGSASPATLLSARWPLFLRARFGVEDWSVEATQSPGGALASLGRLELGLVLLAGAAAMGTILVGSALIRRKFAPFDPILAGSNTPQQQASGLERGERLLETLTELDRKILIAGSLQATILWLLPRLAVELDARGAAVILATPAEEGGGTLYVGRNGTLPVCSPCEIPIHSIRSLLESETPAVLSEFDGASFAALRHEGFQVARGYPIRDEKHLLGALVVLDPPEATGDLQRTGLALSDRLSVAVSHWRRKQELARATLFDSLTGLANRELLFERLGRALAEAAQARSVAVVLIGFDGFENINTMLGHRAADELLRLASYRIRSVAHETHMLARLTSNALVLLVPDLAQAADAAVAAEKIIGLFEKPFIADGLSYAVSVSIGIAVAPADGLTAEGLIRSAEAAMHRAKARSAGRIAFFEEVMNDHARRKVWLEHGLRGAMGTGELQLHFQPKVDLATGRVLGAEALLRWLHPQEGVIPPTEFIPTAEASGLILPIGQWVLQESCRRLVQWREAGVHLDHIALNLSVRQLQDDSFVDHLSQCLRTSGIEGHSLELEVTESMFAEQPARLSHVLERIRRQGARIAIDDFGTGYSSLALLQVLPIDVLKIDRAFVRDLPSGTGDAIVKAIIALGRALGKDLVAEGVETEAQLDALRQRGCRSAQGFYFAPALTADEFVYFYRHRQSLVERGSRARRA